MEIVFLGTGASAGIPIIGCHCAVCTSTDPKNRRLRASLLLSVGKKRFLIDAGPDIREQALRYHIDSLDGLLLTHTHYDHIGGLEELRCYNFMQKKALPCLLSKESYQEIQKLFYYLFEKRSTDTSYAAQFDFMPLSQEAGSVDFCGLEVRYFSYRQGGMKVLGFRIQDVAYVTDIKDYPGHIFQELTGLSTLIVSALRFTESKMQFSIDEAIDFAKKVQAKKTYLMHMAHDIDHKHLLTLLPDTITLAYDGLILGNYGTTN